MKLNSNVSKPVSRISLKLWNSLNPSHTKVDIIKQKFEEDWRRMNIVYDIKLLDEFAER